MRRTPGRRDSQTFRPYLFGGPVEDKVRCHNWVVTDVLDRGGQDVNWASDTFLSAEHLKSRGRGPVASKTQIRACEAGFTDPWPLIPDH